MSGEAQRRILMGAIVALARTLRVLRAVTRSVARVHDRLAADLAWSEGRQ
jgi:hypothetical protein